MWVYQKQKDILPVVDASSMVLQDIVKSLKGIYSFQYNTFINIPVSIIIQLAAASIPAIAASVAIKDEKAVSEKVQMIFRIGFIIGAPCAAAYLVLGKDVLQFIFGKTGGQVLSAGAIGLVFIMIAQLSAAITQAMGKPFVVSINAMIAFCIKIVLNYILMRIPALNIYGVIHSTTLCYVIYSTLNLTYLYRTFKVKVDWKHVAVKPLICAAIMSGISYGCFEGLRRLIGRERISMLIVVCLAVVVYFVLAIITGAISEDDLNQLPGGRKIKGLLRK